MKIKQGIGIAALLSILVGCSQNQVAYEITRQYYDAQGNESSRIIEKYNEDNQILESTSGEAVTLYEYEDDLLVSMINGKNKTVYDYDDNKNLVLAESYQDDELVGSIVYEYDHNQNCIYQYSTSVLGVDDVEIKMVYDNRNHMIEKYQYGLEQDSEIYTIYIYDDKGKCIQEMMKRSQKCRS